MAHHPSLPFGPPEAGGHPPFDLRGFLDDRLLTYGLEPRDDPSYVESFARTYLREVLAHERDILSAMAWWRDHLQPVESLKRWHPRDWRARLSFVRFPLRVLARAKEIAARDASEQERRGAAPEHGSNEPPLVIVAP